MVDDDDLFRCLRKKLQNTGGAAAALRILAMRKSTSCKYSDSLLAAAIAALDAFFDEFILESDYNITEQDILKVSKNIFQRIGSKMASKCLCKKMAVATLKGEIAFEYKLFIKFLVEMHPIILVDEFCSSINRLNIDPYHIDSIDYVDNKFLALYHIDLICDIQNDLLVEWCSEEPSKRYPCTIRAMSSSSLFIMPSCRWNPLVLKMIEQAPCLESMLSALADAIMLSALADLTYPDCWNDASLSSLLQERRTSLMLLYKHENADIRDWAKRQSALLENRIETEQLREAEEENELFGDSNLFERFE